MVVVVDFEEILGIGVAVESRVAVELDRVDGIDWRYM